MSAPALNLAEAVEEAKRMLRGFQGLAVVATALEGMSSIQQAAGESERALEEARGHLADVNAAVQTAERRLAELRTAEEASAHSIVKEARGEAEVLLANAQVQARSFVEAAQAQAAQAAQAEAEARARLARLIAAHKELSALTPEAG